MAMHQQCVTLSGTAAAVVIAACPPSAKLYPLLQKKRAGALEAALGLSAWVAAQAALFFLIVSPHVLGRTTVNRPPAAAAATSPYPFQALVQPGSFSSNCKGAQKRLALHQAKPATPLQSQNRRCACKQLQQIWLHHGGVTKTKVWPLQLSLRSLILLAVLGVLLGVGAPSMTL